MNQFNQSFKQVLHLLTISFIIFLFSIPAKSQDSCATYAYDFMQNELRVFSDTTHWVNWTRSIEYEIQDFPDSGFFHIQTLVHYNSGIKQKNESFYVHVRNSELRFPQDPNIITPDATYKVVPDDPAVKLDGFVNRDAGLFYFEKGKNTIVINHYKIIAEAHPDFVNYYNPADTSNPNANSGDSIGGRHEPESVEVFFIRLISPFCTKDLQLDCTPQFTMDCNAQLGSLDISFDIDEAQMQTFDLADIDSLVLDLIEPSGVQIKNTTSDWQETRHDSLLSFRWVPPPDGANGLLNYATTLLLDVDFNQFDSLTTLNFICRIFTNNDTQLDSQFVRHTVLLDPRCESPVYDLSVSKSGSWRNSANPDTLDYQITIRNHGPDAVAAFVLHDAPDSLLQPLQFFTPPDSIGKSEFFWFFDQELVAGDSLILNYSATLHENFNAGRSVFLKNFVEISAQFDSNPANNRDSTLHVFQTTDLSVAIETSVDSVCLGDSLDFRISIENHGAVEAHGVILQAELPRGLYFNTPNNWQKIDSSANVSRWQHLVASIAAGAVELFNLTTFIPENFTGQLNFAADIFANNDSLAANDSSQLAVRIGDCNEPPIPRFADLKITKSSQQDTVAGSGTVGYQIELTNLGPDTVAEFYMLERWPRGFIPGMINATKPGLTISGDTLRWPGATLSVGENFNLAIAGAAPAAEDDYVAFENIVVVYSPMDTISENNQDAATVIIRPDRTTLPADLIVIKKASRGGGKVGDIIDFELEITNNGPGVARNFTVTDSAASYLQLHDYSMQPNIFTASSARWIFDTELQPGDKIFLQYSATILADIPQLPAELKNRVRIDYPQDSNPGNNGAERTLQVFCGLDCYLDKNVYAPAADTDLEINFETCRTDWVSIKIYDLVGTYVTTVKEGVYSAGVPHKAYWNGFVESGKKMGSGAYILVVHTTDQHCKLKFLLVQ